MLGFVLLRVLAVLLLVAANAFFVASEFALVSVRDTQIQQLIDAGRIGARIVQKLHQRLDELLAAVQLGVTLASLGLGWIGEATLARLLEASFSRLPHVAAHVLAILVAFTLITHLHVVLGEIVPKSIALQKSNRVALAVAGPMEVFITVTRPLLIVMRKLAGLVLRWFGSPQVREGGVHSPEELKLIVTASGRLGMVPPFQEEMILRALEMGEIAVREIMVPRPDIFSIPSDLSLDETMVRVVQEQHSRVPVFDRERGPEHIVGVLYAKDLMRWMRLKLARPAAGADSAPLLRALHVRDIMRDVLFVPETKPVSDLLVEFKKRKRHLAVVVDEFGSTAGVVTVEDVLEQLVGEIEDEFDIPEPQFAPGAATMELDGATPIRDLETQYDLELPRDEGFETLAGFVLSRLQKIPQETDSFEFGGRRFTVLEMDGRRIARVKVELAPQALGKAGD